GLFFLGVWACALGWGGPCQFSGATSLGRDVSSSIKPAATENQLIAYTKISLLLLTVLMIVFGLMRTKQSAWWNVMAWTIRNSATFAPVIAALFWPVVTKRAVSIALFSGFASGLLWYYLGDWDPNAFFLNVHPVWIGSSVNVVSITFATLMDRKADWFIQRANRLAYMSLTGGLVLAFVNVVYFSQLYQSGLFGLFMFAAILCFFIAVIRFVRPAKETQDVGKTAASL